MIVKFYPGESEVEFDFKEPVSINEFRPSVDKIDPKTGESFKEPEGDKIIIVTSNMPDDLKAEVVKLMRDYCNL